MITIYQYPQCGTCKKALRWLQSHGIEARVVHIVDQPPSKSLLTKVLKWTGLPVKKLFNTSGQLYRQGGYKDRLADMTDAEALSELAAAGKLIKRPLLVGDDFALVGFNASEYEDRFR